MKYFLKTIFSASLLFLAANVYADTSNQFEFGQISGPCLYNDCTITFKKTGYKDPLVFLMPSFADGHWNDAPSTLRITSISKSSATLKQFIAPYNSKDLTLAVKNGCLKSSDRKNKDDDDFDDYVDDNKSWCIEAVPMRNISYFVIENNADINLGKSGRIIAKRVQTNKYIKGTQSLKKASDRDKYAINITNPDMDGEYGVLVETQDGLTPSLLNTVNKLDAINEIESEITALEQEKESLEDDLIHKWWAVSDVYYKHRIKQLNRDIAALKNKLNAVKNTISPSSHIILSPSQWFTPSVEFLDRKVYLSLDRSEVESNFSPKRQVAFLMVKGRGVFKGLSFALGQDTTFDSVDHGDNGWLGILSSPYNQCQQVTNIDYKFSEKPFLLASKNSRLGINDGFLRLCKQNYENGNSQVSFVTDEDLNEPNQRKLERNHHAERFGYMAFQQVLSPETCELFPGPAQTWDKNTGEFRIDSNVTIKGTPLIEGQRRIGFPSVGYYGKPTYQECSGERCYPNGLFAKKETLGSWPANNDGYFDPSDIKPNKKEYWFTSLNLASGEHVKFPNGSIIHAQTLNLDGGTRGGSTLQAESGVPDNLIIYVHGTAGQISTVAKGSQLRALVYSEQIISISSSLENLETGISGAVTAPSIYLTGSDTNSPKSYIEGNSACFDGDPTYELMITPTASTSTLCDAQPVNFTIKSTDGSDAQYQGNVEVSVNSQFGGLWSKRADMADAKILNKGKTVFSIPAVDNQAKIWIKGNNAETITVDASIDNMVVAPKSGNYTFIPGGFSIDLKDGHNIVAGEPFDATIKAMTCPTGSNNEPVENYSGTKLLDFSTQYQAPKKAADPNDPIAVEIVNGKHIDSSTGATKQAKVEFTNGESEALTLRYRDAGIISWHVSDPNCTSESCTLTAKNAKETKLLRQQLPDGLTGSVTVNSRPWMFAICPLTLNGKNQLRLANGTSEGGEAYTAAGLPFNVLLKPLVWQSNDVKNAVVDVSNNKYCGYSVTENFLAPDAPTMGSGLLTQMRLATPKGGAKGKFTQGKMTVEPTLKGLLLSGNTWSEVGSIWLQVGMNDYIEKGNDIEQSQRQIGRFYPHYFAFTDTSRVTPAIGDFTYMDQPFDASFTINAFNAANDPVKNYGLFASHLQSQFELASGNYESGYLPLDVRLKQVNSDLSLVTPHVSKWSPASSQIIFAPYKLMLQRKGTGTTIEDGPYHQWQLRVKQKTPWPDNVTWSGEDVDQNGALVGKNDLRYGRMVLESVGGDMSKPLAVPLRVEYWDGTEFVENSDDSISQFNGANYCRQIVSITPSDAKSSAKTSGSGSIVAGKALSGRFMAQPSDIKGYGVDSKIPVYKQQVRLWQRLDNSKPKKQDKNIECFGTYIAQPWLRYNWRQLGDEDPSAIITFGVYRGNDRILYRDEPGIPATDYQ
ncbi:ABC transporter C-terminal domain-containing protein [Photobacterium leiognathi]|uniref:ABC transporter C-terminal domain-containing protein n=1 Tax=Photobacterium leiognathi TaxID=553611 RepID=UPI002738C451|nr:ABC transporter C-terminal domain-containing protein [Photobacterium leiognathi]